MTAHLKLVAFDAEDLAVISTHLELAVMQASNMVHLPKDRRFVFVTRRFDWASPGIAHSVRPLTGVHFDHVLALRQTGEFLPEDSVSLLSLQFVMKDNPAGTVILNFADQTIELDVECLEVHLTDLAEDETQGDSAPALSPQNMWR